MLKLEGKEGAGIHHEMSPLQIEGVVADGLCMAQRRQSSTPEVLLILVVPARLDLLVLGKVNLI